MNKKLRGALIGLVVGVIIGLTLFGLCSWHYWLGAVLGGIIGLILGVILTIGAAIQQGEVESGLDG